MSLKVHTVNKRRNLLIPGNLEETLNYCVDHLLSVGNKAIKEKGAFYIALSGGSTPKAIYQRLTKKKSAIDWSKVFIFWSDERSVGPDHPDSNYLMAMTAGLNQLSIPPSQIFRMEGEGDIKKHAELYEKKIHEVLQGRPFDLIMLGMGEDGHTASLFPETEGLHEKKRLVIANYVPQKNTWRMTMTFPLINASKMAVFYVLGANKQEMLKQVLLGSEQFPCQSVGTEKHPSLWIVDEDAASLVQSKISS